MMTKMINGSSHTWSPSYYRMGLIQISKKAFLMGFWQVISGKVSTYPQKYKKIITHELCQMTKMTGKNLGSKIIFGCYAF